MKKLYEFSGHLRYGIVIAANDEKSARKALEKLGQDW
jgi:hypothetical protein